MGRVSEREKDYFHPIFFLGVIAIIVLIFALSSTSPFFFVYNDNPSSETVVGLNETPESISIVETNYQPFSYRVVSITSPLKIDKINSQNKTAVNMTVTGPVRQTEGVERGEVQVYHYPKILPKNIIESLHNIHPLIATTVVGFVAFTPIYIIYLLIIDPKKPIRELREHFNQPRE